MSRSIILILLVSAFFLISPVRAANIVWISEAMDETGDGIQDDQEWVELLEFYGHEVYTNPGGWADLDPNEIELLNNADLVIFGRSSNSGGYAGNIDEVTTWNSITSPLILMNAYLVRSSRWRWMNTTVMGGLETAGLSTYYPASVQMEVVNPGHQIFTGVTLDENNLLQALDANADSGNFSIIGSDDVGNGMLISKPADQDWAFIAEWQAGVETYEGSGQIPAEKRLYFACGAQAVTDGFGGVYNLTEEGMKLYMNVVDYMLGKEPRIRASLPKPTDNQQEVPRDADLSWMSGLLAEKHDVYIGTNIDTVINANRDNPMEVLVAQDQIETSYTPANLLDYGRAYYWRVDCISETDPNSPWVGNVWSFAVRNYIEVENFESYNDINPGEEGSRRIYEIWSDGYANPSVNGSTIGYPDPSIPDGEHFVETEIVHNGNQSTPILYDNTTASYSEVTVSTDELLNGPDWTVDEPERISLWVYGDPNNLTTEQMYIKVNDAKVIADIDLTLAEWQEVSINLDDFGVDMSNVTTMGISLERTGATGGSGVVFVDDIRLYRPALTVDPGADGLMVSYSLENDTADGSGNGYDGTVFGDPTYVEGVIGMAMEFNGDDYVDTGYTEDLATWTISAWIKSPAAPAAGSSCGPLHRESNYQINWNHFTPSWRGSAGVNVGNQWYSASFGTIEADTWYHLIGTYDGENLKAYKNGVLITDNDSPSGAPTSESNSLKLARHAASDRFFSGTIDEVSIFNRALSDEEILYLAGL